MIPRVAPTVIIETRGPDLVRTGQVDDRDVSNLVASVRWRNVGAWSLSLPNESPSVLRLRVPGAGLIVTLDDDVLLSGPVVAVSREVNPGEDVDEWTFEGVTDDVVLHDMRAWPNPASTDLTAQQGTNGHHRVTASTEAVMRTYVDTNIGPSAPAARRVAGLVLEAIHVPELGLATVTGTTRFETLAEALSSLGRGGGVGFGVRQVGGTLTYETYAPRDVSASVRFDPLNDTVEKLAYSYSAPKLTRAIVGGGGELGARTFLERTTTASLDAEALWGRRVEGFVDAQSETETAKLQQAGDEALADGGTTVVGLELEPADTPSVRFRRDWYVGDRPAVYLPGITEPTTVVTPVLRFFDTAGTHAAIDAATTFGELEQALQPFGSFYGLAVDVTEAGGSVAGTNFVYAGVTMSDFADAKMLATITVDEFAKYPPSFVLATQLNTVYFTGAITNPSTGGEAGGLAWETNFYMNATYDAATSAFLQDYYRGLVHHEFAHTIHQSWPVEWAAITTEWANLNPPGSAAQYQQPFTGDHPEGYVSDYARSHRQEDFAETHQYWAVSHQHANVQEWRETDFRLRGKTDILNRFLAARDPLMQDWHVRINQPASSEYREATPIVGTITEARFTYGESGFAASAILGDPDAVAKEPVLKAVREVREQAKRLSAIERGR